MKKYLRFSTIVFVILALLLSTFPASAGATKDEVNGLFILDGGSYEDLIFWQTPPKDPTIDHFRFEIQYSKYETNDLRLNGYGTGITRSEMNWNKDGTLAFLHMYGSTTIFTDVGKTIPAWDCAGNGFLNSSWELDVTQVCKGVGANAGLQAKIHITSSDQGYPTYDLNAVITDPGG